MACKTGNNEIINLIIKIYNQNNVNINEIIQNHVPSVKDTSNDGNFELIKLHCKYNLSNFKKSINDDKLILIFAYKNHIKCLKYIIDYCNQTNYNINLLVHTESFDHSFATLEKSENILHLAIRKQNFELVKYLIKDVLFNGINDNIGLKLINGITNDDKRTPPMVHNGRNVPPFKVG